MSVRATLLIVDDEVAIGRVLQLRLEKEQLAIRLAYSGQEALAILASQPIDLVVLDVMMPEMDGFETLGEIRAMSNVPVIMLTARALDRDKLLAFASGADDYVTKPFNPDELSARIHVLLRRAQGIAGAEEIPVVYGPLVIDRAKRRITHAGDEVRLSHTEWQLLNALMHDMGKVLTSRQLLTAIWGVEFAEEGRYLHTWVSRLRRKLGTELPLRTIASVGYQLDAPAAEAAM